MSIIAADPAQFNDFIVAQEDIFELFSEEFAQGAVVRTDHQCVENELVLSYGARYLTATSLAKQQVEVPFPLAVDPAEILKSAGLGRGKHLVDNQVKYLTHNEGGKPRLVSK